MFYIWKKIILKNKKLLNRLTSFLDSNKFDYKLISSLCFLSGFERPSKNKILFFSFAFKLLFFSFAVRHFILSSAILHIGICRHLSFIFASRVAIIFADCSSFEWEYILRFIILFYSFQDYLYIHIWYK